MKDFEALNHTRWECKFHVTFIPKCRRKVLYLKLRRDIGEIFKTLAERVDSKVEEGHLMSDHVHMLISIPPKHSVSKVMGYINGKSAIHVAQLSEGRKRNFLGYHFWARGYHVSTVGRDEEVIRAYIRNQEKEDQRIDQLGLFR